MVRSAAKNFQSVGVVTDPADYGVVAAELREKRELSVATRLMLARKAYARTARYDGEIATELERLSVENGEVRIGGLETLPERIHIALERRQAMRYGENPHQSAALYIPAGKTAAGLAGAKQLQGKELSYNNLVDLDSAWALARELDRAGVAIVKHNNPCGAAEQDSLRDAYLKALECDPVSAFGGVMAFNRAIDAATAEEVVKLFVECIVAPGFEAGALEKFAAKKNLRLLEMPRTDAPEELEIKRISGGVLVQEPDRHELKPDGSESGDRTRAERFRNPGVAVRMESLQAREIERHRVRARGADGGYRRRADEPRGFGEDCGDQSGHGWTIVEGIRGGVRCVLSFSRWRGRSRQSWGSGRDSAGRIDARCRRDRSGE